MLDPADLAQWFETHAAPLVLYARQWLDGAAAEDAVQEAFARLMLHSRPPQHVQAWSYRTVRKEAIGRVRSEKRRDDRELRRTAPEIWFDAQEPIDAAAAQAALQEIPATQREVVILRIWAGMTLQEIETITGSPVSTVFDQYQAALRAIREKMGVPCKTSET